MFKILTMKDRGKVADEQENIQACCLVCKNQRIKKSDEYVRVHYAKQT